MYKSYTSRLHLCYKENAQKVTSMAYMASPIGENTECTESYFYCIIASSIGENTEAKTV